ncbi:MAG: EthD domain-containing protein [Candidatus Lambdaproteobacteria bacterium]|nr:EthD domain-containing protein [Candidatus Lambdaproteobacteria bacterium]
MFKITYCLRRLPNVSREEFHRYWREVHGPMVVQYKDLLNVRRYVQNHAPPRGTWPRLDKISGTNDPFEGTAELWYDSAESYLAPLNTPEGMAAAQKLAEDGRVIIDMARSLVISGEDEPFIG